MNIHVETYTASLNKKYEELCGDRVKIGPQRGFLHFSACRWSWQWGKSKYISDAYF